MTTLADLLGHHAVRALSQVAGGRHLRIPGMTFCAPSNAARGRLVGLVGVALAEDLITHFAGAKIYIPKGPSSHNSRTNPIDARIVARLTKRGMTASTIAVRLGCTERSVYAKRAQAARASRRKP